MSTILITGGSGFLGSALTQWLLSLGHEVRVLSRHPDRHHLPAHARLRHQACDLMTSEKMDLTGADAVIHLTGIIAERGRQTFESVHVQATQNVLSALAHSGVKRLIHISALGARAQAPSRYGQTKWAAEELVRHSDLDWTIVQPSIIYGCGDGFLSLYARLMMPPWSTLSGGLHPLPHRGEKLMQPLHVEDAVQAIARVLTQNETIGKTIPLCGPQPLSLREIVTLTAHALHLHPTSIESVWELPQAWLRGSNPILFPLPVFVWRLIATLNHLLLPSYPLITSDQLLLLAEDNTADPVPVTTLLGRVARDFQTGVQTRFNP